MPQTFNLPQYKPVYYALNPQTGYYTKTEKQPLKTPVMRLPYELKITPTQREQIKCNARELIVSRERSKSGNYKFFTGIQETNFKGWFIGNDYEMRAGAKITSLILFHFTEDNSKLNVYYFGGYDKPKTAIRLEFANTAIPLLLQ